MTSVPKPARKFKLRKCYATPEERGWLDRYEKLSWGSGKLFKSECGSIIVLTGTYKTRPPSYGCLGGADMKWVRSEVRRLERKEKRDREREDAEWVRINKGIWI